LSRRERMRDFIIDTNIWAYWWNENQEPEHSHVCRRVSELIAKAEETGVPFRTWISSVTWGEIEYGYRAMTQKERSFEAEFKRFVRAVAPKEFPIDRHVTEDYGRIRALLFETCAPEENKRKGRRPEQLIDPVTSLQLKIQENDLWIVSQAIARNLTLVTNDRKSLRPLLDVARDELHVENWAEANP